MQKYKAKKRFGQNFLIDNHVINKIIDNIQLKNSDEVYEIGPGLGALTKHIIEKVAKLTIIEIDFNLANNFKSWQDDKLTIHLGDALKYDFSKSNNSRIVGNLPYNISTPLLFHLMKYVDNIKDMTFMLQKEVVERIISKPNNKVYGRLSVIMQMSFDVKMLFKVPAEAFKPMPKVESAIIYLKPKTKITGFNYDYFAMIVKESFSKRRKTLRNCLKSIINQNDTDIDLSKRAEMLDVNDFIILTNDYEKTI